MTLVVRNNSLQPVVLEQDKVLGNLQPAMVDPASEQVVQSHLLHSCLVANLRIKDVSSREPTKDMSREQQILDRVDCGNQYLTSTESQQLKSLLMEFADIFALNRTELGSTNLVHHVIDTADSRPCHQPVRRIPFALWEKVVMVSDMLEQSVIRPSKSPCATLMC